MFDSLPVNARGMLDWSWAQFEPYYLDLATRNVRTSGIERFLADWTRLSELVDETHSRLYVATSINTADEEAEKRYHAFLEEIYPNAEEQEQRLRQKLVDQSHIPHGMEIPVLKMRTDAELFREENLPLKTDEQKLCLEYDKIVGAQTVQWDGKEVTVVQLRPVYQKPERSLREKAWRLASQRQLDDREAIADLWRRFMDLRGRMAVHAGYDDYRSFRWKELHRFDYTPDDCTKFHRAIEEVVVPAAQRIAEKRRAMLGVESLRPWDTEVDPLGRGALTPFDKVSQLRLRGGQTAIYFHERGRHPR
ncbi:MAG: M3 family metallopeptidase [Deltaproteobacteria bacterium]